MQFPLLFSPDTLLPTELNPDPMIRPSSRADASAVGYTLARHCVRLICVAGESHWEMAEDNRDENNCDIVISRIQLVLPSD